MPKDKTMSHVKINEAMKAEFLEKGFADASIRSIGARAGLTSAALYRHYSSKEEMFCAMVEPLIAEIEAHMQLPAEGSVLGFQDALTDTVKEVILPHRSEFTLLVRCAQGTRYENYLRDFAAANQGVIADAIARRKAEGCPVIPLDEDELRMLLNAYLTAMIEPVISGCPDEKIAACLDRIRDFFMPGWMKILGFPSADPAK